MEPVVGEPPPGEPLSAFGFFEGPLSELRPAVGTLPYEVASRLWSDNAEKQRFIVLPEGERAQFEPMGEWAFPRDSVVIKNFGFHDFADDSVRLIETRLLMLEPDGWRGELYLWNDDQTEAHRFVGGVRVDVAYTAVDGEQMSHEYVVPNENQCESCHGRDDELTLLGLTTAQVNRDVEREAETINQLEWLAAQGLFESSETMDASVHPAFADPNGDAPVDERARSWLHANCSHCHRPGGNGGSTGLVLLATETDPTKLGICKSPIAAGNGTGGRHYDIVPGDPDKSIMPWRIASTRPDIKMPELPSKMPDPDGLALVREWITAMEATPCD